MLQDAAKVYTYKFLKAYNIFHYNDTGMVPNHPNHQLLLQDKLDKRNGYCVGKSDPFHHTHSSHNYPHNVYASTNNQDNGTAGHVYHHNADIHDHSTAAIVANMNTTPEHKFLTASALGGVSTSTGTASSNTNSKSRKPLGPPIGAMNAAFQPPPLPRANSQENPAFKKGE